MKERLVVLKQLLANELKSDKPGLRYIEDLKLSIDQEECKRDKMRLYGLDYEMVKASHPLS